MTRYKGYGRMKLSAEVTAEETAIGVFEQVEHSDSPPQPGGEREYWTPEQKAAIADLGEFLGLNDPPMITQIRRIWGLEQMPSEGSQSREP